MPEQNRHPADLLASQVIEARDASTMLKVVDPHGQIAHDDAIHLLIRLSYDASLMEEEGRFPVVRLVCGAFRPTIQFGNNIPWDSPPVRDAEGLRRLSPTARRPGSALGLWVHGSDDLRCVGVYEYRNLIDPISHIGMSNTWEKPEVLFRPYFTVRIEGPGRIRAAVLPARPFLLHGGTIQECRSWTEIPAVSSLFEEAGGALQGWLAGIKHQLIGQVLEHPGQCVSLLRQVWGHLLGLTTAARHGGTFVVCLEDAGEGILEGFAVDMDFGEVLLTAIEESLVTSGDNFQAFRQAWAGRRLTLFNAVEQIAGLSAVDGCVLFDRKLNPVRFGVKLHSRQNYEIPVSLTSTGTRHKSAFQYCAEHQAIAWVASQDGHLTVISSVKGGQPEVVRNVDPGASWSQV